MENETSTTPNVEGQATEQQRQAANQPFAIFPDSASFKARVDREARQLQDKTAKELGYDSFEAMKTTLQAARPIKKEEDQPVQSNEADRFRLMLQVGAEINLPAALISRLQGNTADELKADAERLQALFQSNQQQQQQPKQGIPNAPQGNSQPVTFTKEQLTNAAFVRENQVAIMAAARDGRIR